MKHWLFILTKYQSHMTWISILILLQTERPKLYSEVWASLSAIGLTQQTPNADLNTTLF